jgi:hypothetical protein
MAVSFPPNLQLAHEAKKPRSLFEKWGLRIQFMPSPRLAVNGSEKNCKVTYHGTPFWTTILKNFASVSKILHFLLDK